MLPGLARALESLFGSSIGTAARSLSTGATIGLAAAIVLALARVGAWLASRRNGWERVPAVRCPRCRHLVADPAQKACPEGHPVRFPPGAERQEARRQRRARWTGVYPIVLSFVVVFLAAGAFLLLRVGALASPLARILAAVAYFFFLAAVYSTDFALSPRHRGFVSRLLHAAIGAVCLIPFLVLAFLSRAVEPSGIRVLGQLWTTPTASYISDGKRSTRIGPSATRARGNLIEARAPALDLEWQGIESFEAGATAMDWEGRGGSLARLLHRWEEPLRRHGVELRRSVEEIPLSPNVQVRIIRENGRIRFEESRG
jgi:hypothetical protein